MNNRYLDDAIRKSLTDQLNAILGDNLDVRYIQWDVRFHYNTKREIGILIYACTQDEEKQLEYLATLSNEGVLGNVQLHRTNWNNLDSDKHNRKEMIQWLLAMSAMMSHYGGGTYSNESVIIP